MLDTRSLIILLKSAKNNASWRLDTQPMYDAINEPTAGVLFVVPQNGFDDGVGDNNEYYPLIEVLTCRILYPALQTGDERCRSQLWAKTVDLRSRVLSGAQANCGAI